MNDKILAFDIEITQRLEEGVINDKPRWPARLGVTCVGLAFSGELEGKFAFSSPIANGRHVPTMTDEQISLVLKILESYRDNGYDLVSINGLSFDLFVLGRETGQSEDLQRAAKLALNHIDIGYQMVCEYGFMAGLDAMGKGMKTGGKGDIHGEDAPKLWAGSPEDQEKVIDYVLADAYQTLAIYKAILAHDHELTWINKQGQEKSRILKSAYGFYLHPAPSQSPWLHPNRLLTALEANQLPVPERSWDRQKFIGWALECDSQIPF